MATKPKDTTCVELIRAKDVKVILNVGINKANEIVNELAGELEAKGYFVIPHRIPKAYLYERYGLKGVNQ